MDILQRHMNGRDGVGWKQIRQMRMNERKNMGWEGMGKGVMGQGGVAGVERGK